MAPWSSSRVEHFRSTCAGCEAGIGFKREKRENGRIRSVQATTGLVRGGMVLSAGLANLSGPPHQRPQTHPAHRLPRGPAPTLWIETCGPQWPGLVFISGSPHSSVGRSSPKFCLDHTPHTRHVLVRSLFFMVLAECPTLSCDMFRENLSSQLSRDTDRAWLSLRRSHTLHCRT